jgi:quercetin dioxygenase-like cupin family protein
LKSYAQSDFNHEGMEIAGFSFIRFHAKVIPVSDRRIYPSKEFFQASSGDPIRSVVTESADAVVVAWLVAPGQSIAPHVHPSGRDVWTILSGRGRYIVAPSGESHEVVAGDIAVANAGQVHGVINDGAEPLTFISVVAPIGAGFELVEMK